MSVTFANPHGMPIRIARIRFFIPSAANDLTLVTTNTKSQVFIDLLKAFLGYPWPGDVREIEHGKSKDTTSLKILPMLKRCMLHINHATLLLHATVLRSKSTGFDGHVLP
jgi:hypothetical protein